MCVCVLRVSVCLCLYVVIAKRLTSCLLSKQHTGSLSENKWKKSESLIRSSILQLPSRCAPRMYVSFCVCIRVCVCACVHPFLLHSHPHLHPHPHTHTHSLSPSSADLRWSRALITRHAWFRSVDQTKCHTPKPQPARFQSSQERRSLCAISNNPRASLRSHTRTNAQAHQ